MVFTNQGEPQEILPNRSRVVALWRSNQWPPLRRRPLVPPLSRSWGAWGRLYSLGYLGITRGWFGPGMSGIIWVRSTQWSRSRPLVLWIQTSSRFQSHQGALYRQLSKASATLCLAGTMGIYGWDDEHFFFAKAQVSCAKTSAATQVPDRSARAFQPRETKGSLYYVDI